MKDGNWIAIDKNLAKHFPDRKYSEIEAAFSLTLDYDNNKNVTVSGYAKLWQWSRSKVRCFLDSMSVEIIYPEDTTKNQKQKGQIKRQIKDRSENKKGQIRMVDTKAFNGIEDRSEIEKEQIKDRSKDTTSKPINNPNPTTIKKVTKKRTKKPKIDSPEINDFINSISETTKNLCREKNIGQKKFKELSESCFDHFKGKGEKKADWEATVRNWIRNDEKFNKKLSSQKPTDDGNEIARKQIEETKKYLS